MFLLKSIIKRVLLWLVVVFFASSIGMVVIYRFFPVFATPLMIIRLVQQHDKGEKLKLKHHWVAFDDINKNLAVAVVASEDQLFLQHNGFDVKQIKNAAIERLEGSRRRGGSTISQQTAKNVFLWPNSSWVRKGFEVYFTVLIEFIWDKRRIMEVYLNSIEMGNGIYGADAVAKQHFNTVAADLSREQCALIAASLPNPLRFDSSAPSPYMQKRKRAILKQMDNIQSTLTPLFQEEKDEE